MRSTKDTLGRKPQHILYYKASECELPVSSKRPKEAPGSHVSKRGALPLLACKAHAPRRAHRSYHDKSRAMQLHTGPTLRAAVRFHQGAHSCQHRNASVFKLHRPPACGQDSALESNSGLGFRVQASSAIRVYGSRTRANKNRSRKKR